MVRSYIRIIVAVFLCIAVNACGPSTSTPVSLPTETPTLIPTATQTPSPQPTSTITITPFPSLSATRPHLLVQQGEQVFYEYDADGFGRKITQLPPDGHIPAFPALEKLVSPDGEWLAFYTGNIGDASNQENLPITLNLLNVRNGKVVRVADVVTDGYLDKIEQVAEALKLLDPEMYKPEDNHDWVFNSVLSAFAWSIHSVSWSPDSQTLAFAAQIDGNSSDVYVYNLETGAIQQAENSIQSVFYVKWSPDGQYIVFINSEPGPVYTGLSLYAIKPSKEVIDNPKPLFERTWMGGGDWLSANLLLVADGTDTAGNFNLQALDIRTGQLKPLWMDSISDYAIDPLNEIIAINAGEEAKPENWGVYFITFNGRQTKILEGLYWATLFFRGGEQHRFLIQGVSEARTNPTLSLTGDVVGLAANGEPTVISGPVAYDKISISPDNSWLLMYDEENLYVYDAHDNLVQTFPFNGIYSVVWRPDSQAIFFSDDSSIYFLPVPNGEPRLIDECEQYSCSMKDIAWLP